MPTPTKGARLGSGPAHQRLMLAGLATSLFEHGRITTTTAKAKRLRPYAEKLITFAKRGDLHAKRQVATVVHDEEVLAHLFGEIGPRFATRPGGYTRIVKIGPRKGDNAPMAIIELVEAQTFAERAVGEADRARRGTYTERTAVTGSTAEAAADLAGTSDTAAAVAERAEAEQATPAADTDTTVDTANTAESTPEAPSQDRADAAAETAVAPDSADAPATADDAGETPESGKGTATPAE